MKQKTKTKTPPNLGDLVQATQANPNIFWCGGSVPMRPCSCVEHNEIRGDHKRMCIWLDIVLPYRFENTKKKIALFRTAETLDFQLRDEMASKSVKGMVG